MGETTYNRISAEAEADDQAPDHHSDDDDDEGDLNDSITGRHLIGTFSITNSDREQDDRMTVDDAIERLGMGKFQFRILASAGLCFAADAMQVLMLSFLGVVLRKEWDLTTDETAFITSILFIGAIFGTLLLGPIADKKGRKPVFLLAGFIISIFGLAVAFCTSYRSLLSVLFVVGFGVGGLTVPFDILAECIPSHSRGKNLLVIEYFWTIGVLYVVMVAYLALGEGGPDHDNWRFFVTLCALPCLGSVVIGYFVVPESPRWLCTMGRCEEALHILRKAAETNGCNSESLFPQGCQLLPEKEEDTNFLELFSPRWRWTTLRLWILWCAFAFGYYGTIMVITEIFDGSSTHGTSLQGIETPHTTEPKPYDFDYGAIFVSSSAEFVGTTFAIFCVDRIGRIPLQIVSYSLAGLCVYSLCALASNHAHRTTLIALGFAARIFEMSGSCVSWVSTAEILTTEVRTTGHSAANAVARIGSLFAPFLIQGNTSLGRKGLVMLTIHLISVICLCQLPETKGTHLGASSQPEHAALVDANDGQHEETSSEGNAAGDNLIT